ncbi:hypothetical protein EI77_02348 [Prosthecobacter fusiformis]|uniref:YHS domain-containing protein n=1 Tax=Prosthecobacter fusiformis TaxID=48464 RepID=A0A4R7S185_9BACT|nr:hypothetical protein [Prosthecobacter fusiformis]TDU71226.1 hypothetical protein EI77_02348 [Prosthecobacter fusiformis]
MKALIPALLLTFISITAVLAKGGPPINELCPVDGKAGRVIYRVFSEKGTIIFCCATCLDTYQKSPASYPVAPKAEK